jgi:hypothetical protein
VSLRVFGDSAQLCYALSAKKGNDRKISNIWANLKKIWKMLVILRLASIND